jgi:hypothetical protein
MPFIIHYIHTNNHTRTLASNIYKNELGTKIAFLTSIHVYLHLHLQLGFGLGVL